MNDKSEIQKIELGILKEIDKLCKQHDISYFLIGGSMLGAVRHHGFIPWDDDIDIGMLRADYDKFATIAEKELEHPFRLNTFRNNKTHHYYFMHVVNEEYSVRRLGSIDKRVENVWIDIYPIDGFPKGKIRQKTEYCKLQFYRFMYHLGFFEKINLSRPGRPLYQRMILSVLKRTYGLFSIDGSKWRDKLDTELRSLSSKNADYFINYIGMQGERELFKADVFFPLKQYKFEDMSVNGVNDFEIYLTQLYGDWEVPPAKKETHPMEFVE
ncbi:LicD family protein [Butyrivibrio hungatei]|uniref:LicD family protein n=1 Tax=Butyrivibrio hungatei TaxID=185008 RepID=UPI00047FA0C7|nr:LicD family protein [Butyrivibrio hungatei]